jgi:hypothetical protein
MIDLMSFASPYRSDRARSLRQLYLRLRNAWQIVPNRGTNAYATKERAGRLTMGLCIYCGRPAGLFRKQHAACKEQHDYALARIPDFLPKFLDSDLPADRFCELLQEGAKASFIDKTELSQAVARGISNAIDRALDDRLLDDQELERFAGVADVLAPVLSDDNTVSEKLGKVEVLRQLAEARIPDLVDVAGDMPINLHPGETVVWIFNDVPLYRDRSEEPAPDQTTAVPVAFDRADYLRPSALNGAKFPRRRLREEARGDLVTTNRNLFYVRSIDQVTRLSFMKVTGLRAFSDGLEITSGAGQRRVFVIGDVWFAANLLAGLLRQMNRS